MPGDVRIESDPAARDGVRLDRCGEAFLLLHDIDMTTKNPAAALQGLYVRFRWLRGQDLDCSEQNCCCRGHRTSRKMHGSDPASDRIIVARVKDSRKSGAEQLHGGPNYRKYTSSFPLFVPENRPMNAEGICSSPSITVSSLRMRPSRTHGSITR